jgi:hypothetical protein
MACGQRMHHSLNASLNQYHSPVHIVKYLLIVVICNIFLDLVPMMSNAWI